MSYISDKITEIQSTLRQGVTLLAVSKFHPAEKIQQAYDAGHRSFGESRPQELKAKYDALPKDIKWHMIGHLQTNKIKYIAPFVHLIESLDSERLAAAIDREAAKCGRTIDCLLEIHVTDEESKSGWEWSELKAFVNYDYSDLENALTELDSSRKIYFHVVFNDDAYYGKTVVLRYTTEFGYSQKETVTVTQENNAVAMLYPATYINNYTVTFECTDSDGTKLAETGISF